MTPLQIVQAAAEVVGWEALQAHLGVTRQAIWYWRRGHRSPNSEITLKCQELLKSIAPSQETGCHLS